MQLRQGVAVQDVFGLRRERQQIHQHPGFTQKLLEHLRTAKALHASHVLRAAAPAQHRKLKLRHCLRHTGPEHAQTQHPDRKIRAVQRLAKRPILRAGVCFIGIKFPRVANQRMAHVFGHLHGHACVVQPHQPGMRRHFQRQQRVHPRADVERGFELRLLIKKYLRRRPHHGIVGGRCTAVPQTHIGLRQRPAQSGEPGLGLGICTAKGNAHGLKPPRLRPCAGVPRLPPPDRQGRRAALPRCHRQGR